MGVMVYYLYILKWPKRDMLGEIPPIPQKPKNVKYNEIKRYYDQDKKNRC